MDAKFILKKPNKENYIAIKNQQLNSIYNFVDPLNVFFFSLQDMFFSKMKNERNEKQKYATKIKLNKKNTF